MAAKFSGDLAITGNDDADHLLNNNPLALLLGMLLDQQIPMEWAFKGPYTLLERLGELDTSQIASMEPSKFESKDSIAEDWARSRDLPFGTPSDISINTTSPNSFKPTKCARVPPMFPAPIKAIFFLMRDLYKNYFCVTIAFFISAIALAGFNPFGQELVQFIIE